MCRISYWIKTQPNCIIWNDVFRKDVNTNKKWTFEWGNAGESTPNFVKVGFQAKNDFDSQTYDNATFDRLSISNAVCKTGSEKYPVDGIECNYDKDNYREAYYEIENFYRLHSETTSLNPFIDLYKSGTKYNLYVIDLSKQKYRIASQPIRLDFIFSAKKM